MLEDAGKMGTGYHLFDDPVPSVRIMIRNAVGERMVGDSFGFAPKVTFLFMKKTFSVRYEVLEVPDLRPVDGGIIHLGDDAIPQREPDTARCRIGGPDSVLASLRPSGLYAGFSKGLAQSSYGGHARNLQELSRIDQVNMRLR